ncbi:MAG: hypothetical protein ABIW84_01525, partial [Ilumatobacteraceae bacterium]
MSKNDRPSPRRGRGHAVPRDRGSRPLSIAQRADIVAHSALVDTAVVDAPVVDTAVVDAPVV